jgi:hypothetical protein
MSKNQEGVKEVLRRTCSLAIIWTTGLAVVLVLLGEVAVAKGLIIGTVFSIINFFLLSQSIPLTIGRSRARAGLIGLASIMGRYVLLAVPLIIGIKCASFNFVAVVAGIFSMQIVTLVDHIAIRPVLGGE